MGGCRRLLEVTTSWTSRPVHDVFVLEPDGTWTTAAHDGVWWWEASTATLTLVYVEGYSRETTYRGTTTDLVTFTGTCQSHLGSLGTWSGSFR